MEYYVALVTLLGTFSILLLLYGATANSTPETQKKSFGVDIPTVSFVLGIIGLIEFAK